MHPIRGGLNYNLELRWDGVPSLPDCGNRRFRQTGGRFLLTKYLIEINLSNNLNKFITLPHSQGQ